MAFADLNIQLSDLEEYIGNVDPVPCAIDVPKFPVPKESHLNFLKPGSKEVVTRSVHIHEHLPPIYPEKEGLPHKFIHQFICVRFKKKTPIPLDFQTDVVEDIKPNINANATINSNVRSQYSVDMNDLLCMSPPSNVEEVINVGSENIQQETVLTGTEDSQLFKKPLDARPLNSHHTANHAAPGDSGQYSDSVGRPTREILSCIMTTSGFISPAREGKLPDSSRPTNIPDDPPSPKQIINKTNDAVPNQKAANEKHAAKNTTANNGGIGKNTVDDTDSPTAAALKNSSVSKKLLLAGIGKEKSANKKRKLILSIDERKKTKKKMRLLQNTSDDLLISPSTKNKASIEAHGIQPPIISNPLPYRHDLAQNEKRVFDDVQPKPLDIGNIVAPIIPDLPTSTPKKTKKMGERKHKLPKGNSSVDDLGAKMEKPRKKKVPKLSKKKLAAAAALGLIPDSTLPSDLSTLVFTDEQLRLIASKSAEMTHTPRGTTPNIFQSQVSDTMAAHKYTDVPANPMAYDSNDLDKYHHSQPIGSYKNTDKLSTEPDKRKLNIFKKISSTGAANATDLCIYIVPIYVLHTKLNCGHFNTNFC